MTEAVSEFYRELTEQEFAAFEDTYEQTWRDYSMPERQYSRVVAGELETWRKGDDVPPYRVALECLQSLPIENPALLDVGASSGYYSEVLSARGYQCDYTGLDYSEHYQKLARRLYPGIKFDVGDARKLPYPDASFDVVLHGACIMHVKEHAQVVNEAARVAKKYVIFHRTPIQEQRGTICFRKEAYGLACVEWQFAPDYMLGLFEQAGLKVLSHTDVFLHEDGYGHRSYVLSK